jgi:hypothetical protein
MAIQVVATGSTTLTDLNDARLLLSTINTNVNKVQTFDPNTGVYNPSWATSGGTPVVLTPALTIAGEPSDIIAQAKSVTWYKDGVAIDPAAPPANFVVGTTGTLRYPLTINANVMSSANSMRITAIIVWTDTRVSADITTEAEIIFQKVTNGLTGATGLGALTAILSNGSHTVPTDQNGTNGNYTNSGTEIRVYEGTTELLFDPAWTTANGQYKITAAATSITAGTIADSGTFATVGAASAMAAGSDTAKIVYTITGKRSNGTAFTLTSEQTFSKAKTGVAPTAYWLAVSAGAVKKSKAGVLTPTSVTATGFRQTGVAAPVSDASFKFVVGVSTDGVAFTDDAATGAVASTAKAVTGTTKALRFRMYLSSVTPNGTTNMIDETIVPVIEEGVDATSPVVASVWAPDGTGIRNSSGSLKLQADLYDGVDLVSSGATYLWYKLVSGVWTALTSAYTGYNTKTLTVTAAQIAGQGSYKCVVTYNSATYSDAITINDFSDPITVSVIVAEGTVFKNAEGNKTATCKVFQGIAGEIDSGGTLYEYRWFLNKADGSPYTDASFVDSGKTYKTGKTITVTAAQVTGSANLSCELWTKS